MLWQVTHRTYLGFAQELRQLLDKYRGVSAGKIQLGPVMQEMINVSYRHRVPLPASLALTAKALAQMQLSAAQLDPELDAFDVAGRFLVRDFLRRVVAGSDVRTIFHQIQKTRLRAMRIVEGLEGLIGARPGQKPDMSLRASSLEETVRRAGRRLALGLTGGFAVLASALSASSEHLGGWVAAALGLAGAAFMAALAVDLMWRKGRGRSV